MTIQKPHYQVIIIGGGPIGLACGIYASEAGLTYLILEKGALVNSIYDYPVNMTFFSTSERLEIGNIPFVSSNPKPTRTEAMEYYRRAAISKNLNIRLYEPVISLNDSEGSFEITSAKQVYTSSYVIIATGFYDIPYLLNVPGENLPKVTHYYKEPHSYAFQKVLVVGAQNSAVDAALETWRKGAEVTMVIRGAAIGERVKYWVRPDIINRIEEGSIKAFYHSTIQEIREGTVQIQTADGIVTIENDWVIALTGYQPDLEFLSMAGINLCADATRKPDYSELTQETNIRNLFLAGVICGGMNTHRLFIENSRVHAENIMAMIRERELEKSS